MLGYFLFFFQCKSGTNEWTIFRPDASEISGGTARFKPRGASFPPSYRPEIRLPNKNQCDITSVRPPTSREVTDLYPLPDGVVRGRPAVLLVVETRALGRPVGVVLGGGGDLLRGNLSRLHAQRLHTGKRCQRQEKKTSISNEFKSSDREDVVGFFFFWMNESRELLMCLVKNRCDKCLPLYHRAKLDERFLFLNTSQALN